MRSAPDFTGSSSSARSGSVWVRSRASYSSAGSDDHSRLPPRKPQPSRLVPSASRNSSTCGFAGAEIAGVGFVPLNVLSRAQVGKLTEQLGLLPDPGLLVYVRPGRLVVKISGFADKETVAQAAQDAAQSS